jgi:hypothetical protein
MPQDHDVFPPTRHTWIGERLADGAFGRSEILRHVMSAYAWPLEVYFRGSSFRRLGEPLDWVHTFLAEHVTRPGYLEEWLASGTRLRRWLTLGFCFWLKDSSDKERRRTGFLELPASLAAPEPGPDRSCEQAFVARLTQLALERAKAACADAGMADHWAVFYEHRVGGVGYRELAASRAIEPVRAATMARTAARRFKEALAELLVRDGVPPGRVDATIAELAGTAPAAARAAEA